MMFDQMTDDEFRRYVALVCHTLAFRKYMQDNPTARRSAAREYAVSNWREFQQQAIDFCTIQAIREENQQIAHARVN